MYGMTRVGNCLEQRIEQYKEFMKLVAEIDNRPKLLPPLTLKPLLPKKEINYEVHKKVYGTHTR